MTRRLTRNEFIQKAITIHGSKYDYSNITYVYANKKVPIICPAHGMFNQSPNKHLNGQECRKCGNERNADKCRSTKEKFVKKAVQIHGNKYSYDKTVYKNTRTNVIITCAKHGDFEQTPGNHTHKTMPQGCPQCAGKTLWTLDMFMEEARKVHVDKYGYQKVNFINSITKVIITCPIHGDFNQKPVHHIKRRQGCPKCAGTGKGTKERFIDKAIKIHGNRYNYDKVIYTNTHTKVLITCHEHGEFEQSPANHTHKNNPQGCPRCNGNIVWTTEEFIKRAKDIHGELYDYSKTIYKNAITKIEIICPYHGPFRQVPPKHLASKGCPKCLNPRGQTKIGEYLRKIKIRYKEHHNLEGCKYKNNLYFDFLIYVDEQIGVIEYQGQQHYEPVSFGCKDRDAVISMFEEVKKRDAIKREFCFKNNISLLEIPYTKFDEIENLVQDFVSSLRSSRKEAEGIEQVLTV